MNRGEGVAEFRKSLERSGLMILKTWSLHQQHRSHLRTCKKCKFLAWPLSHGLRTYKRLATCFRKPAVILMQAKVHIKDKFGSCLMWGTEKEQMPCLVVRKSWSLAGEPGGGGGGGRALVLHWQREVHRLPSPSPGQGLTPSHLGISNAHWHP